MKWQSLSRVQLFGVPRTVAHLASLSMEFSTKNTGVLCHSLLQGIFPTQGSNPGLRHCRQILYHQYGFSLFGDPFSCIVPYISFEAECLGEKGNLRKYRIVIPPTTMQSIRNFFFFSKFLHWWLSWFSLPISIWSLLSWHSNVIYLPFFSLILFFIMITLLIQLTCVKQGHKLRMAWIWVWSREVIFKNFHLIYFFQKHFKDLLFCPF